MRIGPDTFITGFTNYRVYVSHKVNGTPVWNVETRINKIKIGSITHDGVSWKFKGYVGIFNHLELLDLAYALQRIEKHHPKNIVT